MKWKKNWIICSIIVLVIFAVCFIKLRSPTRIIAEQTEVILEHSSDERKKSEQDQEETSLSDDESDSGASEDTYTSPIDFNALWKDSEDIYAWLDIPGTQISYPILQNEEDDTYYLRRNAKGESDVNGVLYTEATYNSRDFSDPLTVVYGHNMKSGLMFGTLQEMYSSQELLDEHSEIIIYMPDRELHYKVFAAVPFDNRHILYNYDMSDERTFRLFFQEVLSVRSLEAVFAEDTFVQSDEKVVILSTCLTGDRSKRFLVCGKLSETVPDVTNRS